MTLSKDCDQSRVVVPKNYFFLVINCREQFFQSKVVATNHSSMDTRIPRRVFVTIRYIYKMYLTYFYLRQIFISNEHLLATSSKDLISLNVLLTLMFFQGTVVFGNSCIQEDLFET